MPARVALRRIAGDRLATAVLAATLGVAGLAWAVSLTRMPGMGAGPGAFASLWLVMTAAMMLPAAAPAAALRACARETVLRRASAAALLVAGVAAAWLAAGAAGYALLRVSSWQVAAVVALAIACGPRVPSAARCGGLMLAMVATGATGAGWMAAVMAVLVALRVAPVRARPFALALTVLTAALVLASARPPATMGMAVAAQPAAAAVPLCTLRAAQGARAPTRSAAIVSAARAVGRWPVTVSRNGSRLSE
jgi:hypothetical protein